MECLVVSQILDLHAGRLRHAGDDCPERLELLQIGDWHHERDAAVFRIGRRDEVRDELYAPFVSPCLEYDFRQGIEWNLGVPVIRQEPACRICYDTPVRREQCHPTALDLFLVLGGHLRVTAVDLHDSVGASAEYELLPARLVEDFLPESLVVAED